MKISRIIRTSLVILVSVFTLSCSNAKGGPSADDVIAKINNGEKLESADYETMLDYLVDFCDTGEMTANDYESGRSVGEEYPYFMTFAVALDDAPQDIKESERYSKTVNRFVRLMNR